MKVAVSAKVLRHFHAVFTVLWILLILPTLIWWRESVLWVALMSLWANIASHFAAWQATRAEEAVEKNGNMSSSDE